MALPAGVLASTITFGPYTDAAGAVALAGLKGVLRPSSPVVHVPTGQVVIPAEVPIAIASDGTASVGPIPRAGQASLLPVDFTYTVDWAGSSYAPTPGRRTFQLPADSPAAVDYDLLTPAPAGSGVGVLVPSVVTVAGLGGPVTAAGLADALGAELGADLQDPTSPLGVAGRAASVSAVQDAITAGTIKAGGELEIAGTGLVPVAGTSTVTGSGTSSYGGDALRSWISPPVTLLVDTSIVVLDFINWYPNGGADADGPAAMTLRVGIQVGAGGPILPVKFNAQDTVTIAAGGGARSDPTYVDGKVGDIVYWRVTCTMASGSTYVFTGVAGDGYAFGPVQDNSRSGSNYAGGANQAVMPVRVLGLPRKGTVRRVVSLIGDSIVQGANHDSDSYKGPFALALDTQKVPYIKLAKGGESASSFATLAGAARRLALVAGGTDAIVNYGTNDLTGRTLAQWQADCILIWQRLARMGMAVRHTTITPRTTSTDGFATTAGQTPVANFGSGARRQQANDWLRDGAPILAGAAVAAGSNAAGTLRAGAVGHPLVGHVEVADAVESARNSGVWKANFTNDGIHPYADAPRAAIAAAMPSYAAA